MSSKRKQLMENRSEQSGNEMDDGDAETVRSRGWNQFNQNEKDDMIAFLVGNFRDYTVTRLWEKYGEVRNTGTPINTYRSRCRYQLAPNLHRIDCPVKTKLEIYQKYRFKVNEEYIEELKKHADVTLEEGVVVEFKMKDEREEVEEPDDDLVSGEQRNDNDSDLDLSNHQNQANQPSSPPKRKRARAAKASPAEKPKRGRKGAMIEEDVELIVDAVKPGTGIPNPDMIIVVPKQEELNVQEDLVVDEEYFHQGDNGMEDRLMAKVKSMMQGMMETMNESGNKKATELKNEMKAMAKTMQGFMKKEMDSLKKDNKTLAETVGSLKKKMKSIRRQDIDTVPNKKECLLKLKEFVHLVNSPDMEGIEQRIDTAIQDLPENDKDPMPMRKIAKAIDSMLRKMDQ